MLAELRSLRKVEIASAPYRLIPMRFDQVSALHMRYLLAVVDAGSVTAAARGLGIAQPSLSQQIRVLEARVGARLFKRSSHGMALTPAGARLAEAGTAWLAALAGLSELDGSPRHVGIPRGADARVLAEVRSRLGDVVFEPCNTAAATASVRARRLDAAVIHGRVEPVRGLVAHRLISRRLGILTAADDGALAESRTRAFAGSRLLWFDEARAPEHASALLDALADSGWRPELVRLDPASSAITTDALRSQPDLVALRPEPDPVPDGLVWQPLQPPLAEELWLLTRG